MGPNFSQIAKTQAAAIKKGQDKAQAQAQNEAQMASGRGGNPLIGIMAAVNRVKAATAPKAPLPTPPVLQAPAPAPVPSASFQYPEGYDPSGLEAVKKIALAEPGTSAWAQMAKQKQLADEAAQLDKTALQSAGSLAEARDAIAMRGGLSSGASENLARSAMESQLLGQQGVRQAGDIARANIGLQDWQQQMDLLKGLPAAQTGVYAEMMKAKGAEALAKAIEKSGKGSPVNDFFGGGASPGGLENFPSNPIQGFPQAMNSIYKGAGDIWNKYVVPIVPGLDSTSAGKKLYDAGKGIFG